MFLRHNGFALCWAMLILLVCGLPGSEMPGFSLWDIFSFDKAAHAAMFAVLVSSLTVGFAKQYRFSDLRYHAEAWALTMGLIYGAAIEGLQSAVFSERSAEWQDMAANAFGCILGTLVFRGIYGRNRMRQGGSI